MGREPPPKKKKRKEKRKERSSGLRNISQKVKKLKEVKSLK